MADISFNEPQYQNNARPNRVSWLSSLVMKMGLAKDDAGAQRVLLVAAVLIAALAIAVYVYGNPSPAPILEDDATLLP